MSLNLAYSCGEGVKGLKRARFATSLTISTMGISMTLLGIFVLFTLNIQSLVSHVRDKVSIEVFIENGIAQDSLTVLQQAIQSIKGVSSTRFISPDKALERFKTEFGSDPLEILGENPLPASFQVQIRSEYRTSRDIEKIAQGIQALAHVDDVVYHGTLIQTIDRYSRIVWIVDIVLVIIVFFASILLVSNTLRLILLAQKENIEIMCLIGATRHFIRRPYLIQGILQGFMGGVIAALLIWMTVKLLSAFFPHILSFPSYSFLVLIGVATLLGFFGSWLGLQRFLKV